MKEVSLLMCKELLYYWCWISVTIAWKRNTVFCWIWRNFEWVRCFWVQTRVQTYIDRANKQGQGFFSECVRNVNSLLVMLNVFYRGVKNYFVFDLNQLWVGEMFLSLYYWFYSCLCFVPLTGLMSSQKWKRPK